MYIQSAYTVHKTQKLQFRKIKNLRARWDNAISKKKQLTNL